MATKALEWELGFLGFRTALEASLWYDLIALCHLSKPSLLHVVKAGSCWPGVGCPMTALTLVQALPPAEDVLVANPACRYVRA